MTHPSMLPPLPNNGLGNKPRYSEQDLVARIQEAIRQHAAGCQPITILTEDRVREIVREEMERIASGVRP